MRDNKMIIFITFLILLILSLFIGLIIKSNNDFTKEINSIKNSGMSIEEQINTKYSIFKDKVESYPKDYKMQIYVEGSLGIPVDKIVNLYYEKGYTLIKVDRFERSSYYGLEIMMTFLKTNE